MIRAAELRSAITEFSQIQTGIYTFRDKYLGLPGDLKNAEAFWGTAHATDGTCNTTASTGTETCNGNGDGVLLQVTTRSNELFRAWQHLANAGLINGTYTGVTGSGHATLHGVADENIPASKLSNGGWQILLPATYSSDATLFDDTYNNWIQLGGTRSTSDNFAQIITPEEAWNIDTKIDDGKPGQGKIYARHWNTCTTAADSSDLTSEYALSDDSVTCSLMFRNLFK